MARFILREEPADWAAEMVDAARAAIEIIATADDSTSDQLAGLRKGGQISLSGRQLQESDHV